MTGQAAACLPASLPARLPASFTHQTPNTPHAAPVPPVPQEAVDSYCHYFPCDRVLAGVQVPPEVRRSSNLLLPLPLLLLLLPLHTAAASQGPPLSTHPAACCC